MNTVNDKSGQDLYGERIQAVLAKINSLDYRAGMIFWLERAAPELYVELTERLPSEIHRLWSAQPPLTNFDELLARLVWAHGRACELYRHHLPITEGMYADFR